MSKATHVYLAISPCGCATGAATDLGDDDTAESVRDFHTSGRTVERVTFEEYRARGGLRRCLHPRRSAALPTPEQVAYAIDLAPNADGRRPGEIVPADARASIAKAIAADRERVRRDCRPREPVATVDAVRQKLTAIMGRLDLAIGSMADLCEGSVVVRSATDDAKAAREAATSLAGLLREAEEKWRREA